MAEKAKALIKCAFKAALGTRSRSMRNLFHLSTANGNSLQINCISLTHSKGKIECSQNEQACKTIRIIFDFIYMLLFNFPDYFF